MKRHRLWIWFCLPILGLALGVPSAQAAGLPEWLPRYDLDIQLKVNEHVALVRERVTWTNRHQRPAAELVFNAHSHYKIPDGQVGFLAKSLEIMRMMPGEGLDFEGQACQIQKVFLEDHTGSALPPPGAENAWKPAKQPGEPATSLPPPRPVPVVNTEVPFHFQEENLTALVVALPRPVLQGETVTVVLDFTMRLPQKQGRWGQWEGVTYLSNWNPVLAFYDDAGWQPTPFIPWHQPFFNEAGVYTVHVTLPCDQKVACTGTVTSTHDLGNGLSDVTIFAPGFRDFAFLCSARYQEFIGQAGPIRVHCLAFPEHEFYAREMVRIASEALQAYSRWIGPYPFPDFTIAESYFGWNGNECAGLIMIDERVFGMPHLACHYVEYLVSHETCHQWWYNVVGTNGYCETWMDEAMAVHFSYRLMKEKFGDNDPLLCMPKGFEWLPNIYRNDYRFSSLYGTLGRGEGCPTVQELPKFGHIINLFSMAYDRGSKIVGMIEDRLGEPAFTDFMRGIFAHYQFRIIRVADYQHELEAFTGQSWEEFFHNWLYGAGMTDWSVETVQVERSPLGLAACPLPASTGPGPRVDQKGPYQVTVILHQKAEYNEQTVLGFSFDGSDAYQLRIPILPQALPMHLAEFSAQIDALPENRFRVEIVLPCRPTQIAVDPDQVLVDREPANNYWKPRIRWRLTPLYTQLEETDLTNSYDRWNIILGPWAYAAAYDDPWYTRSTRMGVRAGFYRTQQFNGGTYVAFRSEERDVVAGADFLWDHFPWTHTQVGFDVEEGLSDTEWGKESNRAVAFGRYVFQYGSSLYLPPMNYAEVFGTVQNYNLKDPRQTVPGAEHLNHEALFGLHYHLDYLTPYWDPEAGFKIDATYAGGPGIGGDEGSNRLDAQFAIVKKVPDGLGWLSDTRVAARIYGATGWPNNGEYFPMGGGLLFRGFDLQQREGSTVWVGSLEWRVPLVRGLTCDMADHTIGLRAIYGAAFYDVGDAYLNGESIGGVAHAVGAGLRFDVAWFSFVERTILRLDVAKTINADTPVQVWLGVSHPF